MHGVAIKKEVMPLIVFWDNQMPVQRGCDITRTTTKDEVNHNEPKPSVALRTPKTVMPRLPYPFGRH
jgi:hypothetical protein